MSLEYLKYVCLSGISGAKEAFQENSFTEKFYTVQKCYNFSDKAENFIDFAI